jgi:hypothetical protein
MIFNTERSRRASCEPEQQSKAKQRELRALKSIRDVREKLHFHSVIDGDAIPHLTHPVESGLRYKMPQTKDRLDQRPRWPPRIAPVSNQCACTRRKCNERFCAPSLDRKSIDSENIWVRRPNSRAGHNSKGVTEILRTRVSFGQPRIMVFAKYVLDEAR